MTMTIVELLTRDRLKLAELSAIAKWLRIPAEPPPPCGNDDGHDYWTPAAIRRWARDAGHLLPSE
jgi:hypothetical protein